MPEFKDELTPGPEESLSLELNSQAEVPHFTKFDRFRLSQDFHEYAGVKKLLTTVPVKKPNKQQFVRTRLEEGYVLDVLLLEFGENKETYLVQPGIDHFMQATPTRLILTVDRLENWFIWPLKLPRDEFSKTDWHQSAMQAAENANRFWTRIQANMSLGAYEIMQATGELPGPVWPQESFAEILDIAFKDRIIDTEDHIILRQLLGAV